MRSHGVLVLMVLFGCCSAGFRNFGRTTTEDGLDAAIALSKDILERGNVRKTGQNRNEQLIDTTGVMHPNPIDSFGNYQPKETDGNTRLNPVDPSENNHQIDPYNQRINPYNQRIDPYGNEQQIDYGNNHQINQQDNRHDTYGVNQQIDRYGNRLQIDRHGNILQSDRYGNRLQIDSQGTIRIVDQYGNRQLIDPQGTIKIIDQYGNRQQIDPDGGIKIIDQYGNGQQITPCGNFQQGFPNGNRRQPICPNGNSFQNPTDFNGNGQEIDSYYENSDQMDSYGNNQRRNPNGNSFQNPTDSSGNGQEIDSNGDNHQRDYNGDNYQTDSNGENQQINSNGDRHPSSTDYNGNIQQAGSGLCYTENQEWGRCVKTTLCRLQPPKYDPATGFIYKFGDDDDEQSQRDEQCSFLQMCCPLDKINPTPVKPSVRPTPGCGYSNKGGSVFGAVFREKGGSSPPNNGYADFAEFPWMVALLKSRATRFFGGGYIGGGTLIHPSVVMTAAHKVDTLRPSEVKCRAGEWDTFNENEAFDHQERNVRSIVVHEQFDRLYSRFDIALLFTSSPFSIEAHVNVACLSPVLPPPGTGCYSMGWGEDLIKGTNYAILLKKISLTLVSREVCEPHGKRKLGDTYWLHRTLTCAVGTKMLDTCMGDGGSSLVCPIGDPSEQRYGVVGMVAYGFAQCGERGVPGVYVNVPELYAWVGSQMEMKGVSDGTYVVT